MPSEFLSKIYIAKKHIVIDFQTIMYRKFSVHILIIDVNRT